MAAFIVSKMLSSVPATDVVVLSSRRRTRLLGAVGMWLGTAVGGNDGKRDTDGISDGGKDSVGTGLGCGVGLNVFVGVDVGTLLGSANAPRMPPSIKLDMALKLDFAAVSLSSPISPAESARLSMLPRIDT